MNDQCFTCDLSSIPDNLENQLESEEIKNIKNILKDFERDIILCKKCDSQISIEFIDFDTFIGKCNCEGEGKTYSIEKDYEKFFFSLTNNDFNNIKDINDISLESISIQPKDDNISALFSCKEHGKKFKFYCLKCQNNLCDVCKISHKNKNNCETQNTNDFYRFENHQKEILDNINYILKCFKLKNTQNPKDITMILAKELDDSINSDKMNIKRFVSTLIIEYINTPNFNVIQNIDNFIRFIKSSKSIAKINSESEYLEKKNNNLDNITEIIIISKKFDIDLLNNELTNLELLDLSDNCIKNIKTLEGIKSLKLKNLNLYNNNLNNDNIEIIKKLNFPELESLNLERNEFSNYNIFEAISHFTKLKILFLGTNQFIFREEDEKEVKYNFKLIKELHLSNGVFAEKSIEKIFKKFELKDLEFLNLSGNNLKTLSFFKYLKDLKSLETLYLKNNLIDDDNFDLETLSSIESLKNINIEYNFLANDKYIQYAKEKDINLLLLGNDINFDKFIYKIKDINEIKNDPFDKCFEELVKKFDIQKNLSELNICY